MIETKNDKKARTSLIKRILLFLILVMGLAIVYLLDWHQYLDPNANFEKLFVKLRDNREALNGFVEEHAFVAILSFIVIYAVAIAFSIPGGSFLTIAGGFLFGTCYGGIYAVIAATIGATLVFFAAKTAFRDILRQKAQGYLKKMEEGFHENELSYLLVLRLVPLFPFVLVNLVPAFLGVSLRNYIIGTFIGIIPGTFVYASVGNGLDALFVTGGTPDKGKIFEPEILLPILGLVLLSLIPVLYKKFSKEKRA